MGIPADGNGILKDMMVKGLQMNLKIESVVEFYVWEDFVLKCLMELIVRM